jgi:hypothetical protein
MPKVKVPKRIQELAGDLDLNLQDEAEFTSDPEELVAWMKFENDNRRFDENEHRDDIDRELDELEAEMLEDTNDA